MYQRRMSFDTTRSLLQKSAMRAVVASICLLTVCISSTPNSQTPLILGGGIIHSYIHAYNQSAKLNTPHISLVFFAVSLSLSIFLQKDTIINNIWWLGGWQGF